MRFVALFLTILLVSCSSVGDEMAETIITGDPVVLLESEGGPDPSDDKMLYREAVTGEIKTSPILSDQGYIWLPVQLSSPFDFSDAGAADLDTDRGWTFPFATGAAISTRWDVPLPSDYNGGTFTVRGYGTNQTLGAGGDIRMTVEAVAYDDGEALGGLTYGAQQVALITADTANDSQQWDFPTLTASGTPVAGKMLRLRVERDALHVDDDYDNAFYLQALRITYTRQ